MVAARARHCKAIQKGTSRTMVVPAALGFAAGLGAAAGAGFGTACTIGLRVGAGAGAMTIGFGITALAGGAGGGGGGSGGGGSGEGAAAAEVLTAAADADPAGAASGVLVPDVDHRTRPAIAATAMPNPIHNGVLERRPNGESPMSIDGSRGRATAVIGAGGTERGACAGGLCPTDGNSIATGTGRGGADACAGAAGAANPDSTMTDWAGSLVTVGLGGGWEPLALRAEAIVARTSACTSPP